MQDLKKRIRYNKLWNSLFLIVGFLSTMVGLILLCALMIDLAMDGAPRLSYKFLTSFPSRFPDEAGILSAWVGSFLLLLVTALAAIPLGVAAGIYLEEYGKKNWLTDIIEINIANLAGVPSIVYGLLALGLFVYFLKLGESILTGGLTLALLILPMVIMATRESIRAIPNSIREASYALGATKWQTVQWHIIPYSTGGILTGIIIGLSRAIGETAPIITVGALTFIAFLPSPPLTPEFPFVSFKWLMDPFTVMPIQMFNWVSRPQKEFQLNAAAAGIILMMMTLLMNGLAIYIRYRFRKKIKW
ncbi:MAG: phosphate ABC transporter, permease protein PstA [Nitrospirae bacterium CG08_land_8_20_14_0_20_52_24]|nr:MAG: phosphate ABC transporter, permease protein PstA [Nitrospirae bacterium CG08_land_8_20_14_0_20_52_24]PIX84616.1 MAG: phosphate ABC transporter, permease protein PstA [Nitrospirae bacterium CG_4_10_14_3_um_filter_53_41]